MKSEKKKRHTEIGTAVTVRLQDKPLEAVDDWRRLQPDIPNRAEAIRRLTAIALEVEAKRRRGK